jgi:KDO2-lipid IV(A) lauroyltransferase
MNESDVDKRLKINGLEIYEEYYKQGKSVILLTMHYNNWEWLGAMQRFMKIQFSYVYNPMRSSSEFEDFLLQSRVHLGGKSVPIHHSVRVALSFASGEKPQGLMLVADQTAPNNSQFWTTFLNQETAFFSGPMKIAVKTNQPVVLLHIRKTGRGHYEFCNYKLVEDPASVKPDDILLTYIRRIEQIIKDEPEYWLWSHRRWKHKRPEGTELK